MDKDADANAYGIIDGKAPGRRSEPYSKRRTPEYIGSPNFENCFYNFCPLVEKRNPWASLRERLPHDFVDLAPSSRPLSVHLNFVCWHFCNALRW